MAGTPTEARWSLLHNGSMAIVSLAMIGVGIGHVLDDPAGAPAPSLANPRFVLLILLALALLYYVFLGLSRVFSRRPQIAVDGDGIWIGFGRDRRLTWDDIVVVRLRRLALRPALEVTLTDQAFSAANLRLVMWSLDDNLRPVRGQPSSVLIRDNGLDTGAAALLDAIRTFRPNLAPL
ncbi:hypothetical protein [Reyranella sp.]|uniref:hypothetical protein n=1 Tax=Reyranella sp. TaxID=1929291 RepID=UPI003BACF264